VTLVLEKSARTQSVQSSLGIRISVLLRLAIPICGNLRIRLNIASVFIPPAEVKFRVGVILRGGFPIPEHRFPVVLKHAMTKRVHVTKILLRIRKLFIGRFAVPKYSLRVVLIDTAAKRIHDS